MASFFEPGFDKIMTLPENKLSNWNVFPDLIPELGSRFADGDTFGEFNAKTINAYYQLNQ